MNKENENNYLQSLENKAFEEATFLNLTTSNFLREANKKKANCSSSIASSSSITEEQSAGQIEKKLEEITRYVGEDNIKINNNELSIGTIIKREALRKNINYKNLTPSEIALVDCGLNSILDLTSGSLTNQRQLFSNEDWNQIKSLFSTSSTDNNLIKSRPRLPKICRVFKNSHDIEDCYWNAKHYQRKSSNLYEKTGYELVSVILDKMIKHSSIFTVSKPTPSEANIIIKVWADLFEVLFFNTGIHIRWEKGLTSDDADPVFFKLDAKLVLIYDNTEYPVSCAEFAQYSGQKKIKMDRSKLLIEAKTIYNQVMHMDISEESKDLLRITNIQIMGLEAHVVSLNTAGDHLYMASSIKSYILPSTVSQLKTRSKSIIDSLFDFKHYTLNTADTIKQVLNDKKIKNKSMKRKMREDANQEEAPPPPKRKLTSIWRHKENAKN